jgi:hypothetical protein
VAKVGSDEGDNEEGVAEGNEVVGEGLGPDGLVVGRGVGGGNALEQNII